MCQLTLGKVRVENDDDDGIRLWVNFSLASTLGWKQEEKLVVVRWFFVGERVEKQQQEKAPLGSLCCCAWPTWSADV